MTSSLIRWSNRFAMGVFALACVAPALGAADAPACDPDNAGITLPPGFCAFLAADGLGVARHLTAAANGDLYVALQGGGVAALRSTKGDGRFDVKEKFGDVSTTGIVMRNGYLYVASPTSVLRYKMTPGQLKPAGEPEVVVKDLPNNRQHAAKGIAFDGKGGMYVNVGAPSNACQQRDRSAKSPGQDPCPLLENSGGIWKFDENKLGQTQASGTRFATGLRQMLAIGWGGDALYMAMNSRDSLDTLWPGMFTAKENAERPAEPLFRAATAGVNFGWPYCFFDYFEKKFLLNPEYGGDGKTVGRCTEFTPPVAAYPGHWAPVDLGFYTGNQFPAKYRNGVFIVFHGSWNRAPEPQGGYNVTFQPLANGKAAGDYEIFAGGFAGKTLPANPADAVARPDGIATGPDGSMYISDSQKGRVWRVLYRGGK